MTPTASLTLEGFLRGIMQNTIGLVIAIIFILVVMWVARWLTLQALDGGSISVRESVDSRRWINRIGGLVILLVILFFGINAAIYATNAIPSVDLDKSGVYQQMDSNIRK